MPEKKTCGETSIHEPHTLKCPGVQFGESKFTAEELENAILQIIGDYDDDRGGGYGIYSGADAFFHTLADTPGSQSTSDKFTSVNAGQDIDVPGLGRFHRVDVKSDYDEEGDLDCVLTFKFADRYFQKIAYLDSWSGGTWGQYGLKEVKPRTETVVIYD